MTRNIATMHGHLVSRVAGMRPAAVTTLPLVQNPMPSTPSHQNEDRQSGNFDNNWYLGKREPVVAIT